MHTRRWITISALLLSALGCRDSADSPTEPAAAPAQVDVSATSTLAFWQVSAGGSHTCGVATDNRAFCWGFAERGQLGTTDGPEPCGYSGGETCSTSPLAVAGGLRFRQVSAGREHTCGITTDYRAYCWGSNSRSQLGDGTQLNRTTPTPVVGSLRFRQIDAGVSHTCARSYPDNYVYCWGDNTYGKLGDGTTVNRLTPTPVWGSRRFRQVRVGATHTCGITSAYQAFCWGLNNRGQLGDSTEVFRRVRPARVAGGHLFRQVDAGGNFTCAVTTDNRAFCWGDGRVGQLGNGKTYVSFWPRAVAGGLSLGRVTAGGYHACAETTTDRAYCWGSNARGQSGTGTGVNSTRPVAVAGGFRFGQLSVGEEHTCGKTTAAVGYCWGANDWGQLGDGTQTHRLTPTAVGDP